jgi:hypothetical protein
MIMAADSVKTMMADLMASYEQGVRSITPIFSVATLFLGANDDEEAGKKQLRETLSRNGNLRKIDFDRMMSAVTEPYNNCRGEIRLLLRDFLQSQQAMIERLSSSFAEIRVCMESGDVETIKPVFNRIREIIACQERARKELEAGLKEHEKRQREIQTGIRSLLQKGRELQVCDFKKMLTRIKRESANRAKQNRLRREAVSQMLAGYKEQRLKNKSIGRE